MEVQLLHTSSFLSDYLPHTGSSCLFLFLAIVLCLSHLYPHTYRSVEISLLLSLHLSVSACVSALGQIINLRWNSEPFSVFTSPVCVCVRLVGVGVRAYA